MSLTGRINIPLFVVLSLAKQHNAMKYDPLGAWCSTKAAATFKLVCTAVWTLIIVRLLLQLLFHLGNSWSVIVSVGCWADFILSAEWIHWVLVAVAGYFKLIWDGMSILVTLLDAFTMPVSLAWDTYAGMAESWTQLQRAWYLHTVFPFRNIKSQVVRAMAIYHHIPISTHIPYWGWSYLYRDCTVANRRTSNGGMTITHIQCVNVWHIESKANVGPCVG